MTKLEIAYQTAAQFVMDNIDTLPLTIKPTSITVTRDKHGYYLDMPTSDPMVHYSAYQDTTELEWDECLDDHTTEEAFYDGLVKRLVSDIIDECDYPYMWKVETEEEEAEQALFEALYESRYGEEPHACDSIHYHPDLWK